MDKADELVIEMARAVLRDREHAKNAWEWACDQVLTIDEADQQIREWPRHLQLVKDLMWCLDKYQLIAIPKSRRMFVSWTLAVWAQHRARYHDNHAVIWQSEVETKAAFVLDKRIQWVEDHLRNPYLRRKYTCHKTSQGLTGKIAYENGSWILAVAQGANVFRSYTPSIVIMDECDFQPQAQQALAAALPFAEKGAKLVLCSTSDGPNRPLADIAKAAGFVRWS